LADSRRATPPDRTAVGESIVTPALAMRKGGSDGPAVAVVGCGAWGINPSPWWAAAPGGSTMCGSGGTSVCSG